VALRQPVRVGVCDEVGQNSLKLKPISNTPVHVGAMTIYPLLSRLDSIGHILVNEITEACGQNEARDLADVWAMLKR